MSLQDLISLIDTLTELLKSHDVQTDKERDYIRDKINDLTNIMLAKFY